MLLLIRMHSSILIRNIISQQLYIYCLSITLVRILKRLRLIIMCMYRFAVHRNIMFTDKTLGHEAKQCLYQPKKSAFCFVISSIFLNF